MAVLCEVRAEAEQRVKCFVLFRTVVTNSLFPDGKTANAPTKALRRFPDLLWVPGMQEAGERVSLYPVISVDILVPSVTLCAVR